MLNCHLRGKRFPELLNSDEIAEWKRAAILLAKMIYRIPDGWVERRRSTARVMGPLIALLGMGILALAVEPRVNWTDASQRRAAMVVAGVVLLGLALGGLAGRFSFRAKMRRWESFSIELTPEELVRHMDGQETRIQRTNVKSIREYPQRGFVVVDNLGWRIFVPKIIANYAEFRIRILAWANRAH